MEEEKFTTRDYPQTNGYPKTTPTVYSADSVQPAKQNRFVRFLKFVFVKDIVLKVAAVATSVAMFLLMVGLG